MALLNASKNTFVDSHSLPFTLNTNPLHTLFKAKFHSYFSQELFSDPPWSLTLKFSIMVFSISHVACVAYYCCRVLYADAMASPL